MSGSQSELAETISVASITTQNDQQILQTDKETSSSNSSTLRKFRKSFSLRLSRRPSQDETNNEVNTSISCHCAIVVISFISIQEQEQQDGGENSPEHQSPKFRFGPLVWRASRERTSSKKGAASKAARNAKCNSGDSGVQVSCYLLFINCAVDNLNKNNCVTDGNDADGG